MNKECSILLVVMAILTGCQQPPTVPLTDAHKATIRAAIAAKGLPAPNYVGIDGRNVEIQYQSDNPPAPAAAEALGMGAVKAARNAVYVLPDVDKQWTYSVAVLGAAPGPDMAPEFIGLAYMSNNLYRWSPG